MQRIILEYQNSDFCFRRTSQRLAFLRKQLFHVPVEICTPSILPLIKRFCNEICRKHGGWENEFFSISMEISPLVKLVRSSEWNDWKFDWKYLILLSVDIFKDSNDERTTMSKRIGAKDVFRRKLAYGICSNSSIFVEIHRTEFNSTRENDGFSFSNVRWI